MFQKQRVSLQIWRTTSRQRKILLLSISFILFIRLFIINFDELSFKESQRELRITEREYSSSWRDLARILRLSSPKIPATTRFDLSHSFSSSSIPRSTKITLSAIRSSHKQFISRLTNGTSLSTVYSSGAQGIVIPGNYESLPQILITLRLLRRTGSRLPVEVVLLTQEDFDPIVCQKTFKAFGARCLILEEFLSESPLPTLPRAKKVRQIRAGEPLHKYLAIYFSRFEEVLLLDADTLVYNNPDGMFIEEPFLSTGLVLWSDFWKSTISSHLPSVQGLAGYIYPQGYMVDAGQFLISKSAHSGSLLLSIYYTSFGPMIYDVLQNQASQGENGAQAIFCAATYLDLPYYMMKIQAEAVGYPDLEVGERAFHGVAMLQYFAIDVLHKASQDSLRPLFIRQNNPKLNPASLIDQGVIIFSKFQHNNSMPTMVHFEKDDTQGDSIDTGNFSIPKNAPTTNDLGLHHRMWEWFGGRYKSNGWRDPDPERALWEEVAQVVCNDHTIFKKWPISKFDSYQICDRINFHRGQLGWSQLFRL